MDIDRDALDNTLAALKSRLLGFRVPEGHWTGLLSSSALSTATAVSALSMADRDKYKLLIKGGLNWLVEHANSDGGWGDTTISSSNISTTLLCWSAMKMLKDTGDYEEAITGARVWFEKQIGSVEPERIAQAVNRQYGKDRTFSAPILTMCALTGVLGDEKQAWQYIQPLPFELAALPHQVFKWLRMPVVSYALPVLIAIGQVNFYHRRPANLPVRWLRSLTWRRALKVLCSIQPASGGFLESVPPASFITMSLLASGRKGSDIVSGCLKFLLGSVRDDGSWPIDTNLATWLTTLSVNALAESANFEKILPAQEREKIQRWLLSQQFSYEHPYTHAAPGGWAWTDAPGGVPDSDDTAGALIALRNLGLIDAGVVKAAAAGLRWLWGLQNRDGGIATFCRGWTALPFDRSASDLTAHAVSAMSIWLEEMPVRLQMKLRRSINRGLAYLAASQKYDGCWVPLWFGNQLSLGQENPVYGTGRVLIGLSRMSPDLIAGCEGMIQKGADWLLSSQNDDGGWGGDKSVRSSIEETSLAVDALASLLDSSSAISDLSGATVLNWGAMMV